MPFKNPDYQKEIDAIGDRISQYEQSVQYMKSVEQDLNKINLSGFETDIEDIKSNLFDLNAHGMVIQLIKHLKDRIENYKIEYELYQNEFNQLPLNLIDNDKKEEVQQLLSSPNTIYQGIKWIKNIQKYVDKRNRICFPKELTHYSDEYLIGSGGFSRVYKVKNTQKNEIVAVKIPIKNDECIGKSFLRELKNWVSLDHKNIVRVYDFNILPIPYIEMEYCDGCLDDIEKPVQLNLALHYIYGVAEGLDYAHKHNIAHLDLKPQNILLKNDIPKITDWGMSRALTMQGTTTLGISLPFAAPEQFSLKYGNKDAKTDIWQLGILFYYLLTNTFPFTGNDFAEYGKNVTSTNIKKMILEDEAVEEVSHILIKCIAKQKNNRYKNVKQFLTDVDKIM